MITVSPEGFVQDSTGIWLPPISLKQLEIFNNYSRFLLVTGPRFSSKTVGCLHKIMRHAFDNSGAMIAMVAKTVKSAKSSGVWDDLTKLVLPQWINAGIGMRLTVGPKVAGDTRLNYFKVSNRFGTESEIQLHSVDHDLEVEQKFKGTRYSFFYFSEADNFKDRIVFTTTITQLRSFTVPDERLQWLADTNPALEGRSHFLHEIFFQLKDEPNKEDPSYDEEFHKSIDRIEVPIDDNPFISEKQKRILKATYGYRKSIYARYIEGKWEEDSEGAHFSEVFDPNIHVLGDIRARERIVPSAGCKELIVGLDIGDVNHAAIILEKTEVQESENAPVITHFHALDELVVLESKVTIREFSEALLEKMEKWEKYCLDNYKTKIRWKCWSDNSAMRFRAAAEVNDALIVREVTRGRLIPYAAPKYSNSVRDRVRLTYQLLFERRLLMSAQLTNLITSLRMLRKGTAATEYVKRGDKHKHAFDALSYILSSEAPLDLLEFSQVKTAKEPRRLVFA